MVLSESPHSSHILLAMINCLFFLFVEIGIEIKEKTNRRANNNNKKLPRKISTGNFKNKNSKRRENRNKRKQIKEERRKKLVF